MRVKPSKYSTLRAPYLKWGWASRGRYAVVTLYAGGKAKQIDIHRAVALAFHGEPPLGKPIARHIDGNTHNNRADNLAWGDFTDNMADMVRHGRSTYGQRNCKAKLTVQQVRDIRLRYERGETQTSLASVYHIHQTVVSKIVLRKYWKHVK
jgi:hypothetical protein